MRRKVLIVTIFSVLMPFWAQATERAFQVFNTKQITPLVERFYGRDTNAFATLFCNPETPQAMIVDSRLRDLDGKTFYFDSVESCENARNQARTLINRCVVELIINTEMQTASSRANQCR